MTNKVFLPAIVFLALLSACMVGPQVAPASEVIEMKKAGNDDMTILRWVNDPDRTFDLTDEDVSTLISARVSDSIINAMLAKSDEHHREEGHSEGHSHDP